MNIHEQALERLYDWLSTSGLKLVIGLILLWIGFKVIAKVVSMVNKIFERRNVDAT